MKALIDAINYLQGEWAGHHTKYLGRDRAGWFFSNRVPLATPWFVKSHFIAAVKECENNFGNPTTKMVDENVAYLEAQFDKFVKKETKMIPFNLERALTGDKVINGKGNEVSQLHVFSCSRSDCVYGVEGQEYDGGCVNSYSRDGTYYSEPCSDEDLFMAPKQLSGFVNYYEDGGVGTSHKTKKLADKYASSNDSSRTACIDLSQHEEGEGLE